MSHKNRIEPLKAEIISAFLSGESCNKIVQKFSLDCSKDTIRAYLKEWGVDTAKDYSPQRWGVPNSRNEEIFQLRSEGKSQREIAAIVGISQNRVKDILRGIE